MAPESNQPDPGEKRRKTVLPPPRKRVPPDLPAVPLREVVREESRPQAGRPSVPAEAEAGKEGDFQREGMASWPPPQGRAGGRRIGVLVFTVIVPVLMFALVIWFVIRLDQPKSAVEGVPGGELHWFADGLVAIQHEPDSEQKVYYLVVAPRAADPQVQFGPRSMTLVVRTEEGRRELVRPVDWEEAPYAMVIDVLDFGGETPMVPCTPAMIESYMESTGPQGMVAPLAARLQALTGPVP